MAKKKSEPKPAAAVAAREDGQIVVSKAWTHNLKGVSLSIERGSLTVVTGVSGSGKSSLAFDTLYAEGQRRYVESLSAFARQFLQRVDKPPVEHIHGIPPAVAIEQKTVSGNARSTVGTSTEIYDYLRLLYARAGRTFSPVSGREVVRHSPADVADYVASLPAGTRAVVAAPVTLDGRDETLAALRERGFARFLADGKMLDAAQLAALPVPKGGLAAHIAVDRVVASADADNLSRVAESARTAFDAGDQACDIYIPATGHMERFTERMRMDGIDFAEPSEHLFSFNSPLGACPQCDGYGRIVGIDEDLVIPDKSLSVYQDAVACWRGEKMSEWKEAVLLHAHKSGFPVHRPYYQLTDAERRLLWEGDRHFGGIDAFFDMVRSSLYKIQYRYMLSRYSGKTTCPQCRGARLRPEATYVKVGGRAIHELCRMPISELKSFIDNLDLGEGRNEVAARLLTEIRSRVGVLVSIGLGYLTLDRRSDTLSGGESQRLRLATALGSNLYGSLYVLDEPSIGLHPRDTHLLIDILLRLKNLGNTVLVVEHDEEIMRAADYLFDIGPGAGQNGGEIVFAGRPADLAQAPQSLTARYLLGKETIEVPASRRPWSRKLTVSDAVHNNLKSVTADFPLGVMTVVTGVSGSGKSSLVRGVLYPALQAAYEGQSEAPARRGKLSGDIGGHSRVEMVDQSPLGRSTRSNPATYVKAYDDIRRLFAEQQLAKQLNMKAAHFSFNVEGGRCECCQGEGYITESMQFMADVRLVCEECRGRRFKDDVLEVLYRGKSIYDVLEMPVDEAIAFFAADPAAAAQKVAERLQPLSDVGLGYVRLGQASSTLSGGETQRVKLASFLGKESGPGGPAIFIFDEPTTGLHFHDIRKLLAAFDALIRHGHTVICIEHNLEVIKRADWLLDLGPDGGDGGGQLVASGTPEQVARCEASHTGRFLREKLGI